jgi:hypothetical protein
LSTIAVPRHGHAGLPSVATATDGPHAESERKLMEQIEKVLNTLGATSDEVAASLLSLPEMPS